MWRRLLVAGLAGALLAAGGSACGGETEDEPRADVLRVLFVGNSLTETNDLPAEVAALAREAGHAVETGSVTAGGASLEDHWIRGDLRAELETRRWDVVIMQQGPSSLPESREHLQTWASRLADEVRAAGGTPALLTVWPESARRGALAAVVESYRAAADAASAELYAAGAAWQAAWECDPTLELYGPDGFHPSALGTQLAALVVYGRLFRAPLAGLGSGDARTAMLLEAAAAAALGREPPDGRRCG